METSSTKSSIQSEGSLDSERASSKASSSSDFEASPPSRVHTHWLGFISALKKGPVSRLQTFQPTLSIPRFPRRKSKSVGDNVISAIDPVLDSDFYCIRSSWWNFSLAQIMDATDNFNHCNLIGQGGYSEVYKGLLPDGQIVAIKRLTRGSPEEMTADFLSELGIIAHVNHPNVSKIIGYGVDGGMHLVLPLSPNGSLASVLSGSKEKLSWDIRYRIALGTAKGLAYLHEGCQRRIIHKDIKAANILLSEDFEPLISDFGLAKWLPENCTHHTVTKFEGTFGYLPPEFFLHGMVDEKTDVYAYGVLLLELITGRLALDSSKQSLVIWAKPLLTKENIGQLVDPSLGDAYDSEEMDRMVLTASWCIHHSSAQRPQMSQVVKLLCGDQECIELANQCQSQRPTLQRVYSEEISDEKDYNSTKCFKDHNQRLQIA
ncbi:Protein kinase domain [Dillenia turbinata]|uniref:non-specific serine/threonine protein kinase n=1 Tax=Dillenia turbinata TaxID=194707 RepID=A0AAN8UMB2_9MAGN